MQPYPISDNVMVARADMIRRRQILNTHELIQSPLPVVGILTEILVPHAEETVWWQLRL